MQCVSNHHTDRNTFQNETLLLRLYRIQIYDFSKLDCKTLSALKLTNFALGYFKKGANDMHLKTRTLLTIEKSKSLAL